MRRIIISVVTVLSFAITVYAADIATTPLQQTQPKKSFEEHKADILKNIDARIARNQEEKTCVQAAMNHDGIKACRDKFKADQKAQRQMK
jgi:hypothetical protein